MRYIGNIDIEGDLTINGEEVGSGGGGLKSITFDANNTDIVSFLNNNLSKVRRVSVFLGASAEMPFPMLFSGSMYRSVVVGIDATLDLYFCDCLNMLPADGEVQGVIKKGILETHLYLGFANGNVSIRLYTEQWDVEIGGHYTRSGDLMQAFELSYAEFVGMIQGENYITFYYE